MSERVAEEIEASLASWGQIMAVNREGRRLDLRRIYECLEQNDGRMAMTARELQLPFNELGRLIQAVPVLYELVLINRELLIDEAERVVRTAVRSGDATTALAVLKSIGKQRGWSDKDQSHLLSNKVELEYVRDWRAANVADAPSRSLPPVADSQSAEPLDAEILPE